LSNYKLLSLGHDLVAELIRRHSFVLVYERSVVKPFHCCKIHSELPFNLIDISGLHHNCELGTLRSFIERVLLELLLLLMLLDVWSVDLRQWNALVIF